MHHRLRDAIASEERLAVTEPILAEVVTGTRDDRREQQLRRLLARCELLCIAAVSLRHGVDLLAFDADLARIATVMPLSLDEVSLRPG